MSEKLQKVLARAGHGSRREMETVIAAGRVSIDGQVAKLGDRIEGGSDLKVRIDGTLISLKSEDEVICRVLAYYKPEGELCTRTDPQGRPTVFDRLPKLKDSRWVAVGRLDINTSGLLLFTTDGELANRLMHPSHEVEREYAIRVFGEVDDAMLNRLRQGVDLEDGKASFRRLGRAGGEGLNTWYHGVLTEGRNREVRRMWESQEVQVSRLMRIRYGDIPLPKGLPRGGWVELPLEQINYLRGVVEMGPETRTLLAQDKAGQRRQKTLKTNKIRRAVSKHRTRAGGSPTKRTRT
ncbi:23S rRNA pseudouridine(2605) synthase RluB [uncultured Ferrimonas sp.]|uniref:23S rRNA pseudouridine(2605) synthase RluB n=1 Tax=uncultured Ferrimonas sp. TaxID=432640 RepID=UPI002602242F|nr:23S rRNA pseudouridine(2605) synthase RluB [uncultured Ferrimonas sp.]